IGAGMAGLALAVGLREAGVSALILEKSRGLGGRMATRRLGEGIFDHGAQFFTAKSPEFQKAVHQWSENDWTHSWFDQDSLSGSLAAPSLEPPLPRSRWVGSHGMTTVPKGLGEGL